MADHTKKIGKRNLKTLRPYKQTPTAPNKPGFAALMKDFLKTDLYQCILCGDRLRFFSAEKGIKSTTLLSEIREKMAKKRWLQTTA